MLSPECFKGSVTYSTEKNSYYLLISLKLEKKKTTKQYIRKNVCLEMV